MESFPHLVLSRLCTPVVVVTAILVPIIVASSGLTAKAQDDPLPSWNDGPAKKAIVEFVKATTKKASPKYVPPGDRIATFDEDGTTWVEHPLYSRGRVLPGSLVRTWSAKHPEWKDKQPFKPVIDRDRAAMAKFTDEGS